MDDSHDGSDSRLVLARRHFIGRAAAGAALLTSAPLLAGIVSAPAFACGQRPVAAPTVGASSCSLTEPNIEGPFFRAGAPHRSTLIEQGAAGVPLFLSGRVLSASCRPIGRARLELWQADHAGAYDLRGFRFRARVLAGRDGSWSIRTILPGRYLNGAQYRPAHIHVKVHVPGRPSLTTQLYFAGDPYLADDPWARQSLVMHLSDVPGGGKIGSFDFVV